MQIFVKSPTGRTIGLMVNPSDTLTTVKAKIQEQLCLVYDGVQLEDNLTLADYGIQHLSTIDLQEKMLIYVVETLKRRTIAVEVDSFDTLANVKAKIEATVGFPKNRQSLIFDNKQLDDNENLPDLNIHKESTILLILHPYRPGGTVQMFAKMASGMTLSLEVDWSNTIRNVKTKIYMKFGLRPVQQSIIFAGKQLQDDLTLADYDQVNKESTVHVEMCLCGC